MEEKVCEQCPSMTYSQRIVGCLTCIVVGFLISMGSTMRLVQLIKGDPEPFAVMYTLGNIIGLSSSCFLYGPWAQIKSMFAPIRLAATGAYLFFMALTMFLAFYPNEIPLRLMWLVFSIFLQFLALMWYSLTYIPFANQIIVGMLKRLCCNCSIFDERSSSRDEGFWGV